jgi:hypothetical protein
MDETDHKEKIVHGWMNCDHFNPNATLGHIFNIKFLQLQGYIIFMNEFYHSCNWPYG